MSERSIAEIMGWKYHPGSDGWKAPGRHEFRLTALPAIPPQMDVDDMLQWLDAKGYAVSITAARNEGDREIYGELQRYGLVWRMDPVIEFEGPTLHAALEAAVRAASEFSVKLCPECDLPLHVDDLVAFTRAPANTHDGCEI